MSKLTLLMSSLITASHDSFADRDMFTRFAGIGVGHVVQYNLSKVTECEHAPGSCDDELDIAMSDASDPILNSNAGDHLNQTQGEEDDDDESNDEDDEAWDDGDEDDHMSADEDSGLEEYEGSEDEGPEYKF